MAVKNDESSLLIYLYAIYQQEHRLRIEHLISPGNGKGNQECHIQIRLVRCHLIAMIARNETFAALRARLYRCQRLALERYTVRHAKLTAGAVRIDTDALLMQRVPYVFAIQLKA